MLQDAGIEISIHFVFKFKQILQVLRFWVLRDFLNPVCLFIITSLNASDIAVLLFVHVIFKLMSLG